MVSDTTNNITMIFKSTDGGLTWAEIFNKTGAGTKFASINPSPNYATDNTVFAPDKTATIWKSTDGGATWNNIAATIPSGNSVVAFTPIDGNSYWMGAAPVGGIYKSGSYAQVAAIDNAVAVAIIPLPFGILAITGNGQFYNSTDNGATFTKLGDPGFTAVFPAFTFDVPNKTIYAADGSAASNEIKKWVVGTSTAWAHVVNVSYANTAAASTAANIGSLNLAGDGTMYITNSDLTATSYQILRSVNFTAPEAFVKFVGLSGTTSAASDFDNTVALFGPDLKVNYNDTGKFNVLYQVINGTVSTAANGYSAAIKKFTDTMIAKPVVTAPKADDQLGTSFTVTWNAIPAGSNSVTYKVDISTDSGFNAIAYSTTTNATSAFIAPTVGLVQGTKYYLRVSATAPYPTPNSATVPFVIKLGVTGNTSLSGPTGQSISPGPGADNVPANATFQWAAVTGATKYHIQISDNPGFTSPIADAETTDTFFTVSSALKPGTVYYWRIQAISGSIASDYVSNVFTTATTGPAGTSTGPATTVQTVQPTIIVTVNPAEPAPTSTPAYVWVIIVIGAILVIAVIVLIARTRRV